MKKTLLLITLFSIFSLATSHYTNNFFFNVNATDGIHERYVKLSWEPIEGAVSYRILRSLKKEEKNRAILNEEWQQATKHKDADATPGVVYYYQVEAKFSSGDSKYSAVDKGNRPEAPAYAIDDLLSMSETYAAPDDSRAIKYQDSLILASPKIKGKFQSHKTIEISTAIFNAGSIDAQGITARYLLSNDRLLDEHDILLDERAVGQVESFEEARSIDTSIQLPRIKGKSSKYLIVSLVDGNNIIKGVSSNKVR